MISFRSVFIVALQFCLSLTAFGWGKEGHTMTADIAKEHMNKAAKDSLKFYLGDMTIEQASTWMDEIKKDSTLDYLKPLHYINIEEGQSYDPNSTGNIISELNKVIGELKDRSHHSKAEVAFDLKVLIHLVGDLHQPLHVGYGSDKGGNGIKFTVEGDSSNLHRVWDTEIIRREHIKGEELNLDVTKADREQATKIDIIEWMNESRAHLKAIYDFNGNINGKYLSKNSKLVKKQLILGGLRLASLLNSLFS
jgi:hypothetical protein